MRGQDIDAAILAYAPMVRRIATALMGRLPSSVDVQDLTQAGMIGLLDAASSYDDTQGAPFQAFAYPRIHGAMIDELRATDYLSRWWRRARTAQAHAAGRVINRTLRLARNSEIAAEMGLSLDAYHRLMAACTVTLFPLYVEAEDGDTEEADGVHDPALNPEARLIDAQMRNALATAFGELTAQQRLVLTLVYDDEMTQRAVGERLGVTESRISQVHSRAVRKLAKAIGARD